jgi:hypothetical protein
MMPRQGHFLFAAAMKALPVLLMAKANKK